MNAVPATPADNMCDAADRCTDRVTSRGRNSLSSRMDGTGPPRWHAELTSVTPGEEGGRARDEFRP
jgi:hypothetical protein